MATVPVFRQTETLTAMNITNSTDMLSILTLLGPAYTGSVTSSVVANVLTWTLTFQTPASQFPGQEDVQVAVVGNWVVYSSTTQTAIAYNATQFAQVFHT
jgi:hypothetical protein